jgi:hypothetical protein
MDEAEEMSELIGDIYDASLDPDRWDRVLERSTRFLKTATASIGSFDSLNRHLTFSKTWGYDPYYLQLFLDRYAKTNPVNSSAWLVQAGEVIAIGDMVPYEEYAASAIFREWGKPQGTSMATRPRSRRRQHLTHSFIASGTSGTGGSTPRRAEN